MAFYPFLNYDAQLPKYSEIEKIKEDMAFRATTGDRHGHSHERPPQVEITSDTMLVTDVSYNTPKSSELHV